LLVTNSFRAEIRNFIYSINNQKISIRFFNDREVRAVWDDSTAKWWFSVLDIVAVLGKNGVIDHLETDDTDQSFSFA